MATSPKHFTYLLRERLRRNISSQDLEEIGNQANRDGPEMVKG